MSSTAGPVRAARLQPRPRRAPLRTEPRVRAPLRAVPNAIERSGNGVFAGVCMALLAAGLLVLLLLNTALAQGAFSLQQLTGTSGALSDEQHALRQSIEAQSNSAALAQRAAALGMVPAKSMAFLRLSDGAVIGVAEPAKPEPLVVVSAPRPTPAPEATATTPEPTAGATASPTAPATAPAPEATATATAPPTATAARAPAATTPASPTGGAP